VAFVSGVTREQFQVRSELEVVHLPTGAVFRAYPYRDPRDLLQSVRVNWGRTGAPVDLKLSEQIRRMASQLVLERAQGAATNRRLSYVA
jgi:hypothetical protein